MGNNASMSCASGEKSSKAENKEERYKKAPTDKPTENGNTPDAEEVKPSNGDTPKEAVNEQADKEEKNDDAEPAKDNTTPFAGRS